MKKNGIFFPWNFTILNIFTSVSHSSKIVAASLNSFPSLLFEVSLNVALLVDLFESKFTGFLLLVLFVFFVWFLDLVFCLHWCTGPSCFCCWFSNSMTTLVLPTKNRIFGPKFDKKGISEILFCPHPLGINYYVNFLVR